MLPSGLVWTTEQCSKFGGYVCKKRSHRLMTMSYQNKTLKGSEGHLTSPSKPIYREKKGIQLMAIFFTLSF